MAGGELVIRAVENYLAARHAAGFELKSQSYLVRSFARFALRRDSKAREAAHQIGLALQFKSRRVPNCIGGTTRRAIESCLPLFSLPAR